MTPELGKFLRATAYCDCENEYIKSLVDAYRLNYLDDRELAIKLFEFTRDNVKYKVGPWGKRASVTLREGTGMCTNSANLLVALLRAAGIPAAYCIYRVIGGDSFGGLLPDYLKTSISKESVHVICSVYLDGRWIKCDPSTDSELSEKSRHISNVTNLINWDGKNDAVHEMPQHTILSISEPLDNIDTQLNKHPRFIVRYFLFEIGNDYINFLRIHGSEYHSVVELGVGFREWLIKHKPAKYRSYLLVKSLYRLLH